MAIEEHAGNRTLAMPEIDERDSMMVTSLILDTATRLRRALSLRLDEELSRPSAFWILLQLRLSPGGLLRMSDLATQTGLTPSGLTRAIDRLEEAGFVRREACPTDRRGAYAVLTEFGRHRTTIAMTRNRREIEEVLHTTFSPEDEAILAELMRRLRDRVDSGSLMVLEAESPDVPIATDEWSLLSMNESLGAESSVIEPAPSAEDGAESPKVRHHQTSSACGICESVENAPHAPAILYEDDHWLVRHVAAPYGVAGWMTMYSRRHVAGIGDFNEEESASFGPTLSRLQLELERVTGALRIYTLSLGESRPPHFHVHMVPRYRKTPGGVSGWDLFDLLPQAGAGRVIVDPRQVEQICSAFRENLAMDPQGASASS